ncbi:hypothetical protein [Alloyangia pacifica]|uniref:hypothetical protein n=1 Tax=Alloyangia pacifica TaxID=311180 RepID=UPI001CFCA249|nr:hypothetical protein [Alloyangia pacifica]
MVSSSKILTVSYGTFSCTAEGFEDPLGVVKDTTQFFRGVVREDRFFGAEPPQFDPELAAQLLQAQLDAEAQGGRLVLRGPLADVAGAPSQPVSAAPAAGATADVVGPDADRGMETALAETAARAAADAAEEAAEQAAAAEARAAEAETAAIEAAATTAPQPPIAEVAEERNLPGEDSLAAEAAFFASEAGQAGADDYDYDDTEVEMSAPAATPAAATAAESQDEAADSVAAKLRRIRAVVSGGAAAPAVSAQEDADQDNAAQGGTDTVAAVSAMLGTLSSEEDAPLTIEAQDDEDSLVAGLIDEIMDDEEMAAEPAPAAEPLTLTPDLSVAPEAPVAEQDAAQQDVAQEEVAEAKAEADKPRPAPRRVRVVKVTRAAFDAAVTSGQLEQMEEPKPSSSLSAEDEAELARELEAVKAELASGIEDEWEEVADLDALDAAPASGAPLEAEDVLADLEAETAEDAPAANAWGDADWDDEDWDDEDWDESAWTAEEDEELPELAAAEADLDDEDFDDEEASDFAAAFDETPEEQDDELEESLSRMAHEEVRKAVKLSSPARVMLTEQSVEDNDTSRILDETNTQLEEPEGNRRRSAIAHLRAAVAATRADRLLGRKKDAEAQAQPYREDLADVVRPRRPAAPVRGDQPAERPEADAVERSADPRPAPLKLVAEQRVHETAEAPAAPLRPRRVTLADIDVAEGEAQGDFADYADSVGAHDLPELLEAAAAYLSYVEGREQFSRPQLMTKVRQVEGQDTSREDRLRSFGQLLRDGKIEKTGGGRFTVSDRISFKPSARAAG